VNLTEAYIEKLAVNANAFKAGKKLSTSSKWVEHNKSERSIWGAIKGSGKNPYRVSIDMLDLAYKCSCPSRQHPCKHSLAILLKHCNDSASFQQGTEPKDVADWLNKRHAKAAAKEEPPKELTEEELAKRAAAKAKTAAKRVEAVDSGVKELDLWLKDLVRLGLLELPSKDYAFFENVAAKMIDAKAPGLAGRIKAFNDLNFHEQHGWQEEALEMIGQLYLLLNSYKNEPKEEETPYLQTIKSFIGWNFKKKEIQADPNALKVKDQWLILGSSVEMMDDLTAYRTWAQGLNTGQCGYILAFETRFSPGPPPMLVDGTTIETELVFYPGNRPYRAFFESQNPVKDKPVPQKYFCKNWDDHHQKKVKELPENPWINNQFYLIKNIRFVKAGDEWIVCDENKKYQRIKYSVYQYSNEKILTMVMLANHQPVDLSFVEYNDGILPLGIFHDQKYTCL